MKVKNDRVLINVIFLQKYFNGMISLVCKNLKNVITEGWVDTVDNVKYKLGYSEYPVNRAHSSE